jgi:hypothetical protein
MLFGNWFVWTTVCFLSQIWLANAEELRVDARVNNAKMASVSASTFG